MGQLRHGCAAPRHAVRAARQRSHASSAEPSRPYGLGPKTVVTWKRRDGVSDAPIGPKGPRSPVLSKQAGSPCLPPPHGCQRSMTAVTRCKPASHI